MPRVFISHIHEEVAVAAVIREWVTDAFRGSGVAAFVSSDRRDLPAGRKWLDVVRENLEGSQVLVSVLSPAALQRPWPSIELGAGWIRNLHVIPFCHSGAHAGGLGRPFGDFHGVNLDAPDPGRDLIGGVADGLKLEHPKKLHFADFKKEVLAAVSGLKYGGSAAPQARVAPAHAQPILSPRALALLRWLVKHDLRRFYEQQAYEARLGSKLETEAAINELEAAKLVDAAGYGSSMGTHYYLTDGGLTFALRLPRS